MIFNNYYDLIWNIATGISGSIIVFITISVVFDYLRTMIFNNR